MPHGWGQPVEFLKIKLTDCLIESYDVSARTSDGSPEDAFSIAFAKIDFTYTVTRTGEVVESTFDFSANAG